MVIQWLVGVASAQDPVLAITVTAPDGTVMMQDEVRVPADRVLPAPDGKSAFGVYASVFEGDKAIVEMVYGKTKDGKPTPKYVQSFQLAPWKPQTEKLAVKKDQWTVSATLGHVWDAPAGVPTDDTSRYVLAWDDAPMTTDAPPPPVDPAAPKPKPSKNKAPPPPPPFVERPLEGGRTDPVAQASPFKVVDVYQNTHVIAESVPQPGPAHCQVGGPSTDTAPTTRYVALKDLVPKVTAREVVGKLADGTGYTVAAGVPVVQEGENWRVNTGGLSFLIQATPEDLAFYYRPSEHFTGTGTPTPFQVQPGVIGSTALGEVRYTGSAPLPIVGVTGTTKPVATVQVPCAQVRFAPDPAVLGAGG